MAVVEVVVVTVGMFDIALSLCDSPTPPLFGCRFQNNRELNISREISSESARF